MATMPVTAGAYRFFEPVWLRAQRWGLLRLQRLGRHVHSRYPRAPHLLTGERGEFEALFFLRQQGYVVTERRWHAPDLRGDLDLVAWEGDSLAIVEVKTRTARDLTPAASAIDESKRRVLRDLARAYRRTLPKRPDGPVPIRFDVVSVYLIQNSVECELLRQAFLLQSGPPGDQPGRYGV